MASIVDTGAPSATSSVPDGSRRWAPLSIGIVAVAAAGLVAVADPRSNHVPLCALHATTGLDCPLCGGLRAVQSLVEGDVSTAADHNLLFVASAPILIAAWAVWLRRVGSGPTRSTLRRPTTEKARLPRWLMTFGVGVVLAFAVARNLPALEWLDSR